MAATPKKDTKKDTKKTAEKPAGKGGCSCPKGTKKS